MFRVVLYQPEIPPNTGNIGRLCHATGAELHLIGPIGFDLTDTALKRAGLDYWPELNPHVWPDEATWLRGLPDGAILHLLTTKCTRPYWDARFHDGDWLVFGPESRGLPERLLQARSESCLTIPQIRGRSLNLATAAGIVLYEAIRQANCE
jgi:tRNA (cytidine/uridine-2'-O-)-methyltransferase